MIEWVKLDYEFGLTHKGQVVIKGNGFIVGIPDIMQNVALNSSIEVDIKHALNKEKQDNA